MNNYQVFLHPDGKIEAVKFGICWPVFFFGPLWLLYRKVNSLAVLVIVLSALVYLCVPYRLLAALAFPNAMLPINDYDLIFLTSATILALTGNDFLRKALRARGFDPVARIMAATSDDARARYIRSL